MDIRVSLVGLLIGLLIGVTGMGGGSLLAPIMILIFRVPPVWAVGTDIAYSTFTKAVGSIVHIREKHVNVKIAFWLACGSVPATLLSVGLVQYLRHQYKDVINGLILHVLGVTLIVVAGLILVKPLVMKRFERERFEEEKQTALEGAALPQVQGGKKRYLRPALTVLLGAVVGFLVGLTSVGSGTLIIVSLAFLFPRLGPKELVGTDIFQAFLLLSAGLVGNLFAGTINWGMVLLLLLGSIPGVYLGSRVSKYLPEQIVRPLLAVVLVISGWNLI